MPRRKKAVVSKRLKKVVVGAEPTGPKKRSSKRRTREAKQKNRQRSEDESEMKCYDKEDELDALIQCRDTEDLNDINTLLDHPSARVRVAALEQICPCRIWGFDDEEIWNKVFAMSNDPDLGVRKQVLHTLCDGSPPIFEREVIEAVENFNSEPDRDLRRMAHKVLDHYRRTGKWNIM